MAKQRSSNEGSGGKLLDTWIYEYKGIAEYENGPDGETRKQVEAKKVEVELRLIKKFADSAEPPLATKEVSFVVVCKEADIKLFGSDVEVLRTAMWEKLDSRYEVKWERYYLVRVEPMNPFEGIGAGFTFGYDWVEKGTAWDGTILLKERPRYGSGDRISPWPGEFRDKRGRVMACIPHTEANTRALREFSDRINTLREMLAGFLKPDQIVATLANLAQSNFLPAPAVKPEDDQE